VNDQQSAARHVRYRPAKSNLAALAKNSSREVARVPRRSGQPIRPSGSDTPMNSARPARSCARRRPATSRAKHPDRWRRLSRHVLTAITTSVRSGAGPARVIRPAPSHRPLPAR
jgi:hypothetical protein